MSLSKTMQTRARYLRWIGCAADDLDITAFRYRAEGYILALLDADLLTRKEWEEWYEKFEQAAEDRSKELEDGE